MNRYRLITVLMFIATTLAAMGSCSPKSYPLNGDIPAELQAPIGKAKTAVDALARRLLTRLTEAYEEYGPEGAVAVCSSEAQQMTQDIASEYGVEIGRTSHKLRNSANAPRTWIRPYTEAATGRKAQDAEMLAFDLGDRVGLIKPIGVQGFCLSCHGAEIDSSVRVTIRKSYPDDQATGFREGDLRGYFWVELKKN